MPHITMKAHLLEKLKSSSSPQLRREILKAEEALRPGSRGTNDVMRYFLDAILDETIFG